MVVQGELDRNGKGNWQNRRPASHSYFSQRLRLQYLDWGNGQARAMLLVHGVQDHCRTWDWLAESYAHRYHLVTPDLRGHGDSQWVTGAGYQSVDYVYDLVQLMDQAQLAPTVLVAHSMGGSYAALLAGIYPERVAGLVIIEGVGLWPGQYPDASAAQRMRNWIDDVKGLSGRLPRRYESLESAYDRMLAANPHLSSTQAQHLTKHGTHQNEDGSYSWKFDNYTHAHGPVGLPPETTTALWENIQCPVLVMNADDGFDHRIGQDGTDKYFRNLTLVEVEHAGHWAHHDQLDFVVKQIDDFLEKHEL